MLSADLHPRWRFVAAPKHRLRRDRQPGVSGSAFGGGGDHALQEVHWISLEDLSQQSNLDPLLNLLTLTVRPESELAVNSQQILASRPDLERRKSW